MQWLTESEPRPFQPLRRWDDRTDAHDLDRLDEGDLEEVRCGALFVLASTYVGEGDWDEGESSGDDYGEYFDDFVGRISAHYGEPVHGEEELAYSESEQVAHWQVGDSRLVLQTYRDYGDGDIENQLWLAAVVDEPADR